MEEAMHELDSNITEKRVGYEVCNDFMISGNYSPSTFILTPAVFSNVILDKPCDLLKSDMYVNGQFCACKSRDLLQWVQCPLWAAEWAWAKGFPLSGPWFLEQL